MPTRAKLNHIENWVFDLDDTLYPREAGLMQQIDRRMTEYVAKQLAMDSVAARKLQKEYYHHHGTTLRGMMIHHKTDPQDFLDFVHDIDYSILKPDPALVLAIGALPGRKYVYTNGSENHAQNVMERLGIEDVFSGIFDIAAGNYIPKPQTSSYQEFLKVFGVEAQKSLMIDDLIRNLIQAAKIGMHTLWIRHDRGHMPHDTHATDDYERFIHDQTDDMLAWLNQTVINLNKG